MIMVASFFSFLVFPAPINKILTVIFFFLRILANRNDPPGTPKLVRNIELCSEYPHCHSNG